MDEAELAKGNAEMDELDRWLGRIARFASWSEEIVTYGLLMLGEDDVDAIRFRATIDGWSKNIDKLRDLVQAKASSRWTETVIPLLDECQEYTVERNKNVHGIWVFFIESGTKKYIGPQRFYYKKNKQTKKVERDYHTPSLTTLEMLAMNMENCSRRLEEELGKMIERDQKIIDDIARRREATNAKFKG